MDVLSSSLIPLAFSLMSVGLLAGAFFGGHSKVLAGILTVACVSLLAGALLYWPGGFVTDHVPIYVGGFVQLRQEADALSLLFVVLLALVGAVVALSCPGYLKHLQGRYNGNIFWFCLFAFVASMAQVFFCPDGVSFLVFWEIMSLASVALIVTEYASHKAMRAAVIYLGATRVSTTLLLGGFLWLHALSNSWLFTDWHKLGAEALAPLIVCFLGFCIKAGTWPFHLWLPYAHTEAPAPISALMSGIMVKVAIYGLLRVVLMAHVDSVALAYCVIGLGTISAFWGILFAQVCTDLKRLLAYSTVENIGLIVAALGLAMLAKSVPGLSLAGSLAVAAALLHCINHAIYKPLLFLSTGSVDGAAHSRELSALGGLLKRMPWTGVLFLTGAMSICALPPFSGFASKWLIYQSFFDAAVATDSVGQRAVALTVIAALGMVGALSVAAFTKSFGIAFLGTARTAAAEHAHEAGKGTLLAQSVLAALCVALSFFIAPLLQQFAFIAGAIIPTYSVSVNLPTMHVLVILVIVTALIYITILARASERTTYTTWECGYGELSKRSSITAASFQRSILNMFGKLVQYRTEREISGRDRRHFPDAITVKSTQISLIERVIYRPAIAALESSGKWLMKLQTASIHVHLLYLFATLILVIVIGTRQ